MKARSYEWQAEILKLRNRVKKPAQKKAVLMSLIIVLSKRWCALGDVQGLKCWLTFFHQTCTIWWILITITGEALKIKHLAATESSNYHDPFFLKYQIFLGPSKNNSPHLLKQVSVTWLLVDAGHWGMKLKHIMTENLHSASTKSIHSTMKSRTPQAL